MQFVLQWAQLKLARLVKEAEIDAGRAASGR
jgi:hypothetical protein